MDAALERFISAVGAGFAGVAVDPSVRDAAISNLERWLTEDPFVAYRPQLDALIERRRWDALIDAFWQVLPFGTGGRRGPVGIGPNRFNPWTLSTSVQGHVDWLRERLGERRLKVVIAYDVRTYRDRGGLYDHARPNPVLGLSSRDFAELAARVYAANDVEVYLQRRGDPRYVSTPELSYAIRHLKCDAGLNISASHNPPDDNGGKFYNGLGGQEIPPDDESLVAAVDRVHDVRCLSWQKAKDSGFLRPLSEDVHRGYIAHISGRSLTKSRSARVVFTPLHGTGIGTVHEVLKDTGFEVLLVEEQCAFDGDFPTVPFRAPNPEVPAASERAVTMADAREADLVLSTDPDADRIGAVVRHQGTWRFLNGNEIGTLVAHHGLVHGKFKNPLVIQTEVTSGFVPRMTRALGGRAIDHLLVGFKYVGEVLRQIESTGRSSELEATLDDFVCGIEESHGVLVTPHLRDKDAAGGALWLAEAASLAKDEGKTLIDRLEGLWRDYGYVRNHLVSTVMRGAVGRGRIQQIQDSFRNQPPVEIGGRKVTAFHDRRDPQGPFGRIVSQTDSASRDVLVFELGDEARVILRPSGTEPKNKAYVEVRGREGVTDLAAERARVDAEAQRLAEAFVDVMLGRVGMGPMGIAHGVSDLVAVEHKIAFATETLPELVRRLEAGQDAEAWLDGALQPIGKDPRRLVQGAVERLVASGHTHEADLRALFDL